jgi:hypothetical protein
VLWERSCHTSGGVYLCSCLIVANKIQFHNVDVMGPKFLSPLAVWGRVHTGLRTPCFSGLMLTQPAGLRILIFLIFLQLIDGLMMHILHRYADRVWHTLMFKNAVFCVSVFTFVFLSCA